MQLRNEYLHYSKAWSLPDVYLFTGNATVKNNGAIVMGRGAAREVRDSWPGVDKAFGVLIHERQPHERVIMAEIAPNQILGWFQVKHNWYEAASLDLIEGSVRSLTVRALTCTDVKYHLNYPGIGNGGLTVSEVEPVISQLPDNVIVYHI